MIPNKRLKTPLLRFLIRCRQNKLYEDNLSIKWTPKSRQGAKDETEISRLKVVLVYFYF